MVIDKKLKLWKKGNKKLAELLILEESQICDDIACKKDTIINCYFIRHHIKRTLIRPRLLDSIYEVVYEVEQN